MAHKFPLSEKQEMAVRLVKWMHCVPKFGTTSPRFVYYADNWNALYKIWRFTESGEFDSITKDCPAFGAEELRAALNYLDRSETIEKLRKTIKEYPASSSFFGFLVPDDSAIKHSTSKHQASR